MVVAAVVSVVGVAVAVAAVVAVALVVVICFWAAPPKGMKSCRTQGKGEFFFVHAFVFPFVHPSPLGLPKSKSGL